MPLLNCCFNTQPPEGGWDIFTGRRCQFGVSTHSRPKAAGFGLAVDTIGCVVSTHSRPKAAGSQFTDRQTQRGVSTHSRPKAAGQGA